MKRLLMLFALAVMAIGYATTASAIVDVKASGTWQIYGAWTSNMDLVDLDGDVQGAGGDADGDDAFNVWTRVRTVFQFIANENLRGVWAVEIGTANWGTTNGVQTTTINSVNNGNYIYDNGLSLGSDDNFLLENKWLYVDFTIPNTEINVLAGMLPLALPGGYAGSPVLDDDVTAVVVSSPLFDGVGFLGGWARAYDLPSDVSDHTGTNLDVLFAAVPMDFDWITLTPYLAYAYTGDHFVEELTNRLGAGYGVVPGGLVSQNATALNTDGEWDEQIDVWWGGMAFGLNFDPITIDGHFVYGELDGWENQDRSGWEADIALTYTGFDFVTPTLYFVYTSGEDGNGSDNENDGSSDGGKSERLPTLSTGLGIGNFYHGGGITGDDGVDTIATGDEQLGYWCIGLDLADISFVDGLTHTLGLAYFEGTNDKEIGTYYARNNGGAYNNGVAYGATLLEDESVMEYALRTEYQMYDQLTLILDMGYLDFDAKDDDAAAPDQDDCHWNELTGDWSPADATKLLLGVQYDF